MHPHKEIVRKFYEAIWNNDDKAIIPELLCEDFAFRGSLGKMQYGHADFATYLDLVRESIQNYRCDIVEMIQEDDKTFARIHYSGIHYGDFLGYAPTNATLEWNGAAVFTFRDEKIADLWVLWDIQGLLKQLAQLIQE
jgi:steroid delta-isomerase-like uncharacterized protein